MIWFMFVLGIAVGAGGYFLYDKYFNKAEAAVRAAEAKAQAEVKADIAQFKRKPKK